MPRPNDSRRFLIPLEQESTLIAVVELSRSARSGGRSATSRCGSSSRGAAITGRAGCIPGPPPLSGHTSQAGVGCAGRGWPAIRHPGILSVLPPPVEA
jgi:hypothetical protein